MEKKDQKSRIMRLLAQIVIHYGGAFQSMPQAWRCSCCPWTMIAAGTTGLGLVAQHYWGIPLSIFVAGFNILMFVVGLVEAGKGICSFHTGGYILLSFCTGAGYPPGGGYGLYGRSHPVRGFFRRYDRICPGHRDPGRRLHGGDGYPSRWY